MQSVLIVDDMPEVQILVGAIVEQLGCEPLYACTTAEARVIVEEKQPVIAILDMHMPGDSGDVFADELRRHNPGMGILFVTADASAEATLREAGHVDIPVLVKPFRFTELENLIRELLERSG